MKVQASMLTVEKEALIAPPKAPSLPQFRNDMFENDAFEPLTANAGAERDGWTRSPQSNTAGPPTPAKDMRDREDSVMVGSL